MELKNEVEKLMKHAYLILAHEYNYNLESLIASIDDERNDIYIHIDKKSIGFPFEKIRELVKKSQICFVDRINTNWASYRLVEAELILLETALANGNYMYYHLLSGADMPLRNQNSSPYVYGSGKMRYIGYLSLWNGSSCNA